MNQDLLLLHIAQTQYAQGLLQQHIAEGVKQLLATAKIQVPPALAEALGESKVKHDELKAALASAQLPPPPVPLH